MALFPQIGTQLIQALSSQRPAISSVRSGFIFVPTDDDRIDVARNIAGTLSWVTVGTGPTREVLLPKTNVADVAYTALASDYQIAYTSLSAARIVTLPAPASTHGTATEPQWFKITDQSGSCSSTNTITVTVSGGDAIRGAAPWLTGGNVALTTPYAEMMLYCDGTHYYLDSEAIPVDQTDLPVIQTAVAAAGTGKRPSPWNHIHPRETWTAGDYSYKTWSFDPAVSVNNSLISTAGLLHLVRMHLSTPQTITNLIFAVTTAGATLTSGQNFAALFTAAGTLVGQTADQSTAWQSTGVKAMALTTPYVAAAGDYYMGFWFNGTTAPTLARNSGASFVMNAGLSAPNFRFATADSGLTTTAPATFGSTAADGLAWWTAMS